MIEKSDIYSLLPLIIIAVSSVLMILIISIKRIHSLIKTITLLTFILSFLSLFLISSFIPQKIVPLFILDKYSLFFLGLILAGGFAVTILSNLFLERHENKREEYYVLLLLASLGSSVLIISNHFISLFLGLEILSISLYILIAYMLDGRRSLEASIKYLILGSASSSFLLFGMALVYAETGTMELSLIAANIGHAEILVWAGLSMMLASICFKLALVPFQLWAPDVYEGAPAPVTAFIATISKGSAFAIWFRFFHDMNAYHYNFLVLIFSIIAASSMFTGNLLALKQTNLKRLLAYSSIANMGYILVTFLVPGSIGKEAGTFYLITYFIAIIGAFGIVTIFSNKNKEAEFLTDYRGLFYKSPLLAIIFTILLFSLAGLPLTAGFIGKFYIVVAGINSGLWLLIVMMIVNIVISFYYYLRVIITMFANVPESKYLPIYPSTPSVTFSLVAILTLLILYLGIFPSKTMEYIKTIFITI